MKQVEFFHTGDVQGIEITKLPANAKPCPATPVAYGEKSGHIHIITGDYEMLDDGTFKYVKVGPKGALSQHVHESIFKDCPEGYKTLNELTKADHTLAPLKPNTIYKIGIHQQYDPFAKVLKNTID